MKRFHVMPMLLAMLSLVVGLGLSSTSLAKPRGHGHDRLSRLERQIEDLNLDNETRTAIYAMIDQARAEQRDTRRQLREAYDTLRTLLGQDAPEEADVLAQADAIGNLQTTYRKRMLRTLLAIQAQLPPEQRTRLRQAMQEHGDRHHRRGR
jgi:Spy/CpxP family protein refolding chaperone